VSAASRLGDWARRPAAVLPVAVAAQWLATLAVALTAERDGWRMGDTGAAAEALKAAAELVDGHLPSVGTGVVWPLVLAPIAAVAGEGVLAGLPAVVLLDTLVLAPLALVCAYWLAARAGGRLLALWTAVLWVVAPFVLLLLAQGDFGETLHNSVLPLLLGLSGEPEFAAGVALLGAAVLIAWSRSPLDAVLAGLAAGLAFGIAPRTLLFAAGALTAYALRRQTRAGALFLAALAPAVLAVAIWRIRAFDGLAPISFGTVSWSDFQGQMNGLREHFWSNRLLQWVPLAGVIAMARRSVPAAALLAGWLGAFAVVEAASRADLFEALLPALPAYVVLAAAIPLLVPTLPARLGALLDPVVPRSEPGPRIIAAAAILLAAAPLLLALTIPR